MAKLNQNLVFIGIKGAVLALDRATGNEIWRSSLKGGDFVNLVIDGENLYATTKGEIFCLDSSTGAVRWHNKLTGMGYGLVTIATPSSGLIAPLSEKRRRDAAAAAAGAAAAGS